MVPLAMPEFDVDYFDVDYIVNLIVQRCDCLDVDQLREIEVRLSGGADEINVATLNQIVAAIDALEDRVTATRADPRRA